MLREMRQCCFVAGLSVLMGACGSGAAGNRSEGLTTTDPGTTTSFTISAGNPCNSQLPTLFGGSGSTASGDCTIVTTSGTRGYRLHIPLNYKPDTSALVLLLHGSRATGAGIETTTTFSNKADQIGFAVVYPDGLANASGNTTWNSYYNQGYGSNPPDDVAFLRQIITSLHGKIQPNPKKIYVAGFSAGAFMAHRAGAELPDLLAGIASVEGTLSSIQTSDTRTVPPPAGPISVIILHGSSDTTVPYCGGGTSTFTDTSQEQTFNYWAQGDGCTSLNTLTALCDASGNISTVTFKKASSCSSAAEVEIFKLQGGTHTWYLSQMNDPARTPYNPSLDATTGTVTNDILWNFFAAHPKP